MAAHSGSESGLEPHEMHTVLPSHMGGGPMGLGDPNDKTLRRVELEIVIPKRMKESAKKRCSAEVTEFSACGKRTGLLMPFKCRQENNRMNQCIVGWYENEQFKEAVTNEYLADRTAYRLTGVGKKQNRM